VNIKGGKQIIVLKCCACGNSFGKEKKEFTRQTKKGNNNFYCDSKCAGKVHQSTEKAPFDFMATNAKRNAKGRNFEFNISSSYLEKVWLDQKGKCSYTGVDLILPTYKHFSSPRKASLDRIDSSKGYIEGNVEFVCIFVNLGKNGFKKEDILSILHQFKNGVVTKA
jgi:hypothetical protein